MMGGYGVGWGGGWGLAMGLGWIIPIVVIGLVIWMVVFVRQSRRADSVGDSAYADRSLSILKARFAKGELDRETYQRVRNEWEH